MAVPPIEINVRADTAQAEASLKRVGDQAEVAGTRVRSGASGMTAGAVQANRSFMVLGGQSRMLTQQLSQVAQQATATGNVGQALAVQAADIGLAFGTVGTIVGALAGIALPSLIAMLSDTEAETGMAEDALDGFRSSLDAASQAANMGILPIGELREEYGRFAMQVQQTSRIVAQAALAQGMRDFEEAAGALTAPLAGVSTAMAEYQRRVNILTSVQDALGEKTLLNAAAYEQYEEDVDNARQAVVDAAAEMGLTAGQAEILNGVLERMKDANGPEEIAEQAGKALEIFDLMYTSASNIPPEIAELVNQLRQVQLAASQATADMEALAEASAMQIGVTTGDGSALAGMSGDELLPPGQGGDGSGGRGGRAPRRRSVGGVSRRDTTQADLERVQEFLMSETELIQSAHEERLEALRAAREAELLTKEQFNELEAELQQRHADRLIQIDAWKYGNQLDQAEAFFGKAANALAGGNSKMIELSRKFAAVEATINAGRAFAQVAADPSLPWFAKIPAAIGVASAISQFATSSGIGGGGGGSGGGGAASAAQQAQQPITTFSFTLQNDPMGFGESFARQMIEQLNATQRNGGTIRGVINNA